jgi:hypothetical protein
MSEIDERTSPGEARGNAAQTVEGRAGFAREQKRAFKATAAGVGAVVAAGAAGVGHSTVSRRRFATHGVCTARQAVTADPMDRQGVTRPVHHARLQKLSRHGAPAAGKLRACGAESKGGIAIAGKRAHDRRCALLPPSPGIPGEGWGEGDFERKKDSRIRNESSSAYQRFLTLQITLTPALSRSTGRGGSAQRRSCTLRKTPFLQMRGNMLWQCGRDRVTLERGNYMKILNSRENV